MTGAVASAIAVPRVLIWRHGRTSWNAEGRFQGQLDPPLDEVGRQQADRAAAQLAAVLPRGRTALVSSDLERATSTAAPLGALLGIELRPDPRLRELDLGTWQGLTRVEIADRYPDQYADWLAGRAVRGRGSEEPDEVASRALAALEDLPPAEVAVVVTHGGTGLRLIEALLGLEPAGRRLLGSLSNCSWSELVQQSDRWRLVRHNQSVDLAGPALADGRTSSAAGAAEPAGRSLSDADAVA